METTYSISGMVCAACGISIEETTRDVPGILDVRVHFASETLIVNWKNSESRSTHTPMLQENLRSQGYKIVEIQNDAPSTKKNKYPFKLTVALCSLLAYYIVSGAYAGLYKDYILSGMVLFSMLFAGYSFYRSAYLKAWQRKSDMNTLIALSTLASMIFSLVTIVFELDQTTYLDAVLYILTFTLLGKFIERRAQKSTVKSMRSLLDLQPKKVTVIDSEAKETLKDVSDVNPGDHIKIKQGERIPVDGIILRGTAFVDQGLITGESVPTSKEPGDKVYTGSLNRDGLLIVEVKKVGAQSVLHQIVWSVEKTETQGLGGIQPIIDRVASIFVPSIVVLSIGTLFFGGLVLHDFSLGLLNAINVLVISCPCALVLGPSLGLVRGIRDASKLGIYIRKADVFNKVKKLAVVVMDKTGTLTTGKLILTDVYTTDPLTEAEEIAIRVLEKNTFHPVARALENHFSKSTADSGSLSEDLVVENYEVFPGKGISGTVGNTTYVLGNRTLMADNNCELSEVMLRKSKGFEASHKTLIFFAKGTEVRAVIAFEDPIRPSSKNVIAVLKKKYAIETHMLTGDTAAVARPVAHQIGITKMLSQALPSHKAEYINNLQTKDHLVAMVGDGINDTPALAQSDVAVALNSEVDLTHDTADVSIFTPELEKLLHFLEISHRTNRTVRQNLIFAFLYNVLTLPIAMGLLRQYGVELTPAIASFAMAASSLSVVINSLGKKYKPKNDA